MLAIARRWRYKWASGCSYVGDNRCANKYSCLLGVSCAGWALQIVLLKNKFLKFQCVSCSCWAEFRALRSLRNTSNRLFSAYDITVLVTTYDCTCSVLKGVRCVRVFRRAKGSLHITYKSGIFSKLLQFVTVLHIQIKIFKDAPLTEYWNTLIVVWNVHICPLYVKGNAIIVHKLLVVIIHYKS